MGYLPSYQAEVTPTNPGNNFVSTVDTISKMISLVMESVSSPIVIRTAMQILQGIGSRTTPSEKDCIRAVFWWVKHHVQFKEDEYSLTQDFGVQDLGAGMELLLSPTYLLSMPAPTGDCDDYSTLIASLLKVMGFQHVGFRTVAADKMNPGNYTHVYVVVGMNDGSVFPLDASHGTFPGWETDAVFKKQDWWIQ